MADHVFSQAMLAMPDLPFDHRRRRHCSMGKFGCSGFSRPDGELAAVQLMSKKGCLWLHCRQIRCKITGNSPHLMSAGHHEGMRKHAPNAPAALRTQLVV